MEIAIIIAVPLAVGGLVLLAIRMQGWLDDRGVGVAPRRSLGDVRRVMDRSAGMVALRRLTGRSSSRPAEPVIPPTALTADEVAYRIGVAGAPVPATPEDVFLPAAAAATRTAAAAAAARPAASSQAGDLIGDPAATSAVVAALGPRMPVATTRGDQEAATDPRVRLVRDAAVALLGLAIVGLIAINLIPQQSAGPEPSGTPFAAAVQDSPTPRPTPRPSVTKAAAVVTAAPTASPTASPTPLPIATPKPTPRPTRAAPRSTPRPTARPTPRPTPVPTPTPKPKPTVKPTPVPVVAHISAASCTAPGGSIAFNGSGSTGETAYTWNFDDGSGVVHAANPTHSFDGSQATYTVILTVTGPGGSDSTFKVIDVPC